MPVELSFEEPALFVITARGEVTYDQVHRMLGDLLAHQKLAPGTAIYIDNRGVTKTPSIAEVALITRQFAGVFSKGARRVAIVTGGEVVYRVSQVFAGFASTVGATVKVFRDEESAREWVKR